MAEKEDTTLQTRTKLLLPQPHARCSNTWRIPALLFLFTHAKLELDRCHFGERIRQKPIMKEKHEIINDNVKVCWITAALQNSDEDVLVLFTAADLRGTLRKICPRCLFCYPSAPSVSIFPLNLKIFLPLLGVNSWPDVLSWLLATKFGSEILLWHRLNSRPSAKAICPPVTKWDVFCLLKSFIQWQNNPST